MASNAESLFEQGRALFADGNRDPERAVVLLAGAADLGHGGACLVLGRRLGSDDPAAGLGWLRRGVELGDDECRYETAVRLLMGLGTAVDEAAAADLLQTAAERGHAGAADALAGLRRRQASRSRSALASLRAAVAEFGLRDHGDRIAAAALPSARLVGTPSEDPPVGTSRIGGAPDLGEGVAWPAGVTGPLSFIAQVDLAAVAECLPGAGLPRGGLLSFFYDAETQPWGSDPGDRTGWQVVHTVDTRSLRRHATPADVVAFRPVTVTARPELTVPFGRTMEGRGLGIDAAAWPRYVDLQEVFADDFQPQDGGTARHRMWGHPDAIQGDMRRRIEGVLRGVDLDATDTPELDEAATRWVLLLQVDSDDDAGMMWGDAGRLFFWLPEEALAAGDFSAVFLQLQCY